MKLLNALSLNMVPRNCMIEVNTVAATTAANLLNSAVYVENCIGHVDTDVLVRAKLYDIGADTIDCGQRVTVNLSHNETAIVAQYIGPRLTEGATALPEGSRIEFKLITIRKVE